MTLVKVNHPKRYVNGWMNDLLNDFPSAFENNFQEGSFAPQVNITETPAAYVLQLSAPGRAKEDFVINLEKNLLSISAENKDVPNNENEKQIRREFKAGAFKRAFSLDEKIDAEKIEAKYENGLLTLSLPKKEDVKPAAKQISVL